MIAWITGLSGSGKTRIGREVRARLREAGVPVVHLDGDQVRAAIADPRAGYDRGGRLLAARRMSRLAAMLAEQGLFVVVSTVSLLREVHRDNRAHLPGYLEVVLRADLAELTQRDVKGIYGQTATPVAGRDLEAEWPEDPHLVIENDFQPETARAVGARIAQRLLDQPER